MQRSHDGSKYGLRVDASLGYGLAEASAWGNSSTATH